jgi:hypothetical protein
MLATFVTGEHSAHCSGCPACSPTMAAMLTETSRDTALRCMQQSWDMATEYRQTESLTDGEQLARRLRGFGSVCVEPAPDGYAAHLPTADLPDADPYLDGRYDPRGVSADGYSIGLALRQVKKETTT